MIAEQHIPIQFVTWPCGCINDHGTCPPHATWHVAYACSWCDAVVSRPDLQRWYIEAQVGPPRISFCPPLLRVGDELVEIYGVCPDGHPLVKERVRGAKTQHLEVPMSTLEIVKN
jgi:hypothetical protein